MGEKRRATRIATVAAAALIAHQVAGKSARDALYLSQFPASSLPVAMSVTALASLLGALLFSRGLDRIGPGRLVPVLLFVSGVLSLGEWFLALSDPRSAAIVLYLHMGVLGLLLISGFWSLVNEAFDPHSARQAIGRIVSGSILGGIAGGLLADRIAARAGVAAILPALATLHLFTGMVLPWIDAPAHTRAPMETEIRGFALVRRTPYLRTIALFVMAGAAISALLDYSLKATAARTLAGPEALVSFFALFYATTGLAGYVLQRFAAGFALRRFGLAGMLGALPALVCATSLTAALTARIWAVTLARASDAVLSNSLFRSGLEILYTPLSPERKRSTKALIDVAAQRGGDLIGAALVLVLLFIAPGHLVGERAVLAAASLAAGTGLVLVARLNRGYVAQLTSSLRRGLVALGENSLPGEPDLASSNPSRPLGLDPVLLEEYRERIRATERATPVGGGASGIATPRRGTAIPSAGDEAQPLLDDTRALLSREPLRIRAVLTRPQLDPRLAVHVLPLVSEPNLQELAASALVRLAPRTIGLLADALLDSERPMALRLALPSILERAGGRRAAEALAQGLIDTPFEIRNRCGRALVRTTDSQPHLAPPQTAVFDLARLELEVDHERWLARPPLSSDESPLVTDPGLTAPGGRSLEHLFLLLSLALDRDAVRLALRGLLSGDAYLEGTAREYLENVLPERIRERLWGHLAGRQQPPGERTRRAGDLIRDLQTALARRTGRRSGT